MNTPLHVASADTPADIDRLRTFVAARGTEPLRELERHLTRPRYRPAFTRIAEHNGRVAGYALIGHQRLRVGAATLEAGHIAGLDSALLQNEPIVFAALLGDCLRVLVDEQLPIATLSGPIAGYEPFGFAEYRFNSTATCWNLDHEQRELLRPILEQDLEDIAALYEASYNQLPLTEVRAASDWRHWLNSGLAIWGIEDPRGRLVAYAAIEDREMRDAQATLGVREAAAADAGAARMLCVGLLGQAKKQGYAQVHLQLPPWHSVAQAALQLWARISLSASRSSNRTPLAGVVDLPLLLEALVPEFERRLAISRYAGWSGNLRLEIETERITLAWAAGHATVIDGSRPADLRLRQITLPALAQLCLGYRVAADLRATSGLACDDSALGLLDALFPTLLATE